MSLVCIMIVGRVFSLYYDILLIYVAGSYGEVFHADWNGTVSYALPILAKLLYNFFPSNFHEGIPKSVF